MVGAWECYILSKPFRENKGVGFFFCRKFYFCQPKSFIRFVKDIQFNGEAVSKEKTKQELLAKIIDNNLNREEFFINKAIGWALRDYSKTNPPWVKEFLASRKNGLAKLSLREASKYLR